MTNFEKVCDMLHEKLGIDVDKIKPESEIVKDLGADSLDLVDLFMSLEDNCGITVSDEEAENIKTIQDVVNLMEK